MVKLADVLASNRALKTSSSNSKPIAVFVGATAGIGRSTLKKYALNTATPHVYVVARSRTAWDDGLAAELQAANANGTYDLVLAGDLTLLKNVDKACTEIKNEESRVDLLFMSFAFVSFSFKREDTGEGLDEIMAVRYYARMRFLNNLLPQLSAATSPRVVCILAGGLAWTIAPDDLGMLKPKNQGFIANSIFSATYTTLFLEQMALRHPKIAFVHAAPGFVKTESLNSPRFWWWQRALISWVAMPLMTPFATSIEESGQRAFFVATDARFCANAQNSGNRDIAIGSNGIVGSGMYTVQANSDAIANDKAFKPMREKGWDKLIFDHTLAEFARIDAL